MPRSSEDREPEYLNSDTVPDLLKKPEERSKKTHVSIFQAKTVSKKNIAAIITDNKKSHTLKKKLLRNMLNNYLDSKYNIESDDEMN